MKDVVQIDVYPRFLKVTNLQVRHHIAFLDFEKRYSVKGKVKKGRRWVEDITDIYAFHKDDLSEFRFHRGVLDDLKKFLLFNGFEYELIEQENHRGKRVKFTVTSPKQPRLSQPIIVEYLSRNQHTKICALQTGQGKTMCTLWSMANIGLRTAIMAKKSYLQQWKEVLEESMAFQPGDIMFVRDGKDLEKLFKLALVGQFKSKVLLVSVETIQSYINNYLTNDTFRYSVLPEDFVKVLDIGLKVLDESHQKFLLNLKIDCFFNFEQTISLTATPEKDQEDFDRIFDMVYPKEIRAPHIPYIKYINVGEVWYRNKSGFRLNTKARGPGTYSHIEFEKSLMQQKQAVLNYLKIIEECAGNFYSNGYKEGDKMLVLASSVEFCKIIANYLGTIYPDKMVGTYTAEDPMDNLKDLDIIVSTGLSAGTAVDISQLTLVIMTTAINSKQSNEQYLGRLRMLPDKRNPVFLYFVCQDIARHREYCAKKRKYFADKVLAQKAFRPINNL